MRAIEIETYNAEHAQEKKHSTADKDAAALRSEVKPFIIGTTFPRDMLRSFIRKRLKARLDNGMIEEAPLCARY